jgi:hypothetical protein
MLTRFDAHLRTPAWLLFSFAAPMSAEKGWSVLYFFAASQYSRQHSLLEKVKRSPFSALIAITRPKFALNPVETSHFTL